MNRKHPPFFIIGIPRSGTTLLEKILDNHSLVGVCPESTIFKLFARWGSVTTFTSTWHYKNFMQAVAERLSHFNDPAHVVVLTFLNKNPNYEGDISSLLKVLGKHYLTKKKKPILGEKTPENSEHLRLIAQICPTAKYIFILRNPLDIVCSVSKLLSGNSVQNSYSNDVLLRSAAFVKRTIRALYDNNIDEKQKIYLTYENLVNDTKNQLTKLCHFLSIPYEEQMIHFNAENYIHSQNKLLKNTHQNLTKPINNKQVNRYLEQLSRSQIKMLQLFLKNELTQTHYKYSETGVTLNLNQKFILIKHQILFLFKPETLKEYYIRFKIKLKFHWKSSLN